MNITSLEECMKHHLILMTGLMCLLGLGSACQTGSGGSSQLTQTGWSAQCGDSTVPITKNTSEYFSSNNCKCPFSITMSSSDPTCQFIGSNASSCSVIDCTQLYNDVTTSNSGNQSGGSNGVVVNLDGTTCALTCPGYSGV